MVRGRGVQGNHCVSGRQQLAWLGMSGSCADMVQCGDAGPFTASQKDAFVLFAPDSVASGTYVDALAYLNGMGIGLHGFRWIKVTNSQVAELYGSNRMGTDSAEDILVDRLFTSGPSLACWLTAPHFSGPSLVDTLRVLKGHKDPAECRPGHLRHLLGAENTVMNCMHSSDSLAHAVKELQILGVSSFVRGEVAPNQDSDAPTPEREFPSALWVACRVFAEAVHSLCGAVPKGYAKWQEQGAALARMSTKPEGVLTELQQIWGRQAELVELAVGTAEATALRRVASICSASFNADDVAEAIRPLGLALSPWEDLILRCQQLRGPLPQWIGPRNTHSGRIICDVIRSRRGPGTQHPGQE
ncbi:nucleoside-diphosphate kinase [Streptomyces sp. NPDC006552]|uniref:nucleoside-diphosphate kinase n=1 Tax=Streptomyces sp. NPDC006552 TaxID=3157179 RepID=UPI0033BEC2CE